MKAQEAFVGKPKFYQRLNVFRFLLVLVIIFTGLLTLLVKRFDYFRTDLFITRYIQGVDWVGFKSLMVFLSWLGDILPGSLVVFLATLSMLLIKKTKAALMIVVSGYGAIAVSESFKFLIGRPRPDADLINQIGKFTRSDSFPSGHVLFSIGLYGFLFFLAFSQIKTRFILRTVTLVVLALPPLLMGVSRIYLGAHWFSDVMGAYLIGYIWLFMMINLYRALDPQVKP